MNKEGRNLDPPKCARSGPGRPLIKVILHVLALTSLPATNASSPLAAGDPHLVVDNARYEFGEMFAGEDLSHVFWVRNNGTAPLELSETPLLGAGPSKVAFYQPHNGLTTGPPAKVGRAAPS